MYTLYIDTHSNTICIVLFKDEKIFIKNEVKTNQNHSITTMPIIIKTLEEASITIQDINQILVVNGPGSFTGVRLGVTIAKTLAYTLNVPIKVFSSLLIKSISFKHENVNIIEREKNGVFIGEYNANNELLKDYIYLKNGEYSKQNEDYEDVAIDYQQIILYAKTLDAVNPHLVNPLYVKKIEVQK